MPKTMLKVTHFTSGVEGVLRDVFYSAIRDGCIKDYTPEQIAAWAPEAYDHAWWDSLMHRLRPYVAWQGSDIVGYADLQEDGYVDHFFVHGQHQRQGVGKALMETIVSEGAAKDRLYCHVSHTAKPFFESNGFVVIELRVVELRGVKMENFLMERRQAPAPVHQPQ